MAKIEFTAISVRTLLNYSPETGIFIWKIPPRKNTAAGSIAGNTDNKGYRRITQIKAHRLAWLYMTGSWPQGDIDHIDGDKSNNRFENLRDIPHAKQSQNLRRAYRSNRTTGVLGVSVKADCTERPFIAQLRLNRRNLYIGSFATLEEARAAYIATKRKLHPYGTI